MQYSIFAIFFGLLTIFVPVLLCDANLHKITGRVHSLPNDDQLALQNVLKDVRVLVNYGQYTTFMKEDGSFEVSDLSPDSYIVEIVHPKYMYEPIRVDITSKGKIRARRINYIQPSLVQTVDYPFIFRPKSFHNYFLQRETWHISDVLLNPMVILMVVPLVILLLLPKLMNPEEIQQQREAQPELNVPELSEMITNVFGNSQSSTIAGSSQTQGTVNQRHQKHKKR